VSRFHSLQTTLVVAIVVLVAIVAPVGAAAAAGFVHGESLTPTHTASGGTISMARKAAGPTAPTTGSPATPVGSAPGLLFDGSSIDDYGVEAAPHAITEVADPNGSGETVFKMTVANDDVYPVTPTDNPRAQALTPAVIEPGDEFWLSTKFMIPKDMPFVSGWMSLVSIYGPPFEGSSPWQISVNQDEFRWMREDGRNIPWHAPLVKGNWQTVTLHERFGSDGFVEMWWNGQRITFFDPGAGPIEGGGNINPDRVAPTDHLVMPTMDHTNDAGPNSAKIMQYREAGMFGTASVYFGPLKLGTTRAAVEG
jgi:polysaccharide lyase-like protein